MNSQVSSSGFDLDALSEQTIELFSVDEIQERFIQNKIPNSMFEIFFFGKSKHFYSVSPVLPKRKVILDQKGYSALLGNLRKYCKNKETESIDEFRKQFTRAKHSLNNRQDLCELRFQVPIKPII